MDYEQKYKEALERARVYHTGGSTIDAHITEVIFPELKESEDEKNIKDLIDELKCSLRAANCQNYACEGGHEKRIALLEWSIAWLEKQGEKNIPLEEIILNVWELGNYWKELTKGVCNTEYGSQLDYIVKHWKEGEYYMKSFEKQGKQ